MKYASMLLVLTLATALPAGEATTPEPRLNEQAEQNRKQNTELAQKAAKTSDAEAKAKAEAKKKAEAQEKRRNWGAYYDLKNQMANAAARKDFAKVDALSPALYALMDKPSQLGTRRFGITLSFLGGDRKKNAATLKKHYEFLISKASGDVKGDWMTGYAKLLKEQKLAEEDEIAKILADRYKIAELSSMKRIEFLVADNELEQADALASEVIAGEKEMAKKAKIYGQLVRFFSQKKVFGSPYVNRYYQAWIAVAPTPDAKAKVTGQYADYAKEYALMSDEEADERFASGLNMPGVTDACKVSMLCGRLRNTPGAEQEAVAKNALALAGADFKARLEVYKSAISLGSPYSAPAEWLPGFAEKAAADQEWVDHLRDYARFLRDYAARCRIRRLDAASKFLEGECARMVKLNAVAAADHQTRTAVVQKAKDALQKAQAAEKIAKDNLKAKWNNLPERKKAEAELRAKRELRDEASKFLQAKSQEERAAGRAASNLEGCVCAAYDALSQLYDAGAHRLYESKNPYLLKKAITAQQKKLAVISDPFSNYTKLETLLKIADLAYDARDYALVRQAAAEAEALCQAAEGSVRDSRDKRRGIEFRKRLVRVRYPLGFAAYDEENYGEAVTQFLPLIDRNDYRRRGAVCEKLVRSYTALGDLDNAVKYSDRMLETAPRFMKKRFEQQIKELKERAAEAAAK